MQTWRHWYPRELICTDRNVLAIEGTINMEPPVCRDVAAAVV